MPFLKVPFFSANLFSEVAGNPLKIAQLNLAEVFTFTSVLFEPFSNILAQQILNLLGIP